MVCLHAESGIVATRFTRRGPFLRPVLTSAFAPTSLLRLTCVIAASRCRYAICESPTLILAAGSVFPPWRMNLPMGVAFFSTRILYYLWVYVVIASFAQVCNYNDSLVARQKKTICIYSSSPSHRRATFARPSAARCSASTSTGLLAGCAPTGAPSRAASDGQAAA